MNVPKVVLWILILGIYIYILSFLFLPIDLIKRLSIKLSFFLWCSLIAVMVVFSYCFIKLKYLFGITLRKSEYSPHKNYLLIFVCHSSFFKDLSLSLIKFRRLLKTLKTEGLPFKIIIPQNEKQFCKEMSNLKAKIIFVFGHGVRHGVRISYNMIYYCKFKRIHSKKYVVQMHCNEYGGKSLKDYCKCEGISSNDVVTSSEINSFIDDKKYVPIIKRHIGQYKA